MVVVRPPLDLEPVEPADRPEPAHSDDVSPRPVLHEPAIPQSAHDAITVPVAAAPVDPEALVPAARIKPPTAPPPMDELDTGWDLGDEDPTAAPSDKPEGVSTPSSSEMAGDGAVEGDGIDTGWD
jgi:hypothetical protein